MQFNCTSEGKQARLARPTAVPVQILIQNGARASKPTFQLTRSSFAGFYRSAEDRFRANLSSFATPCGEQSQGPVRAVQTHELLAYLAQLQHQAQAIATLLPAQKLGQLSTQFNNSGLLERLSNAQAQLTPLRSQRPPQTEADSNSSLLQLNNTVFDSCSTGSLLGSLKPFVADDDKPTQHPSDQVINSGGVTAVTTSEVAMLSSNDQSACLSTTPSGLRHVLEERRGAKKSKFLHIRTPLKSRKLLPQGRVSEDLLAASDEKENEIRSNNCTSMTNISSLEHASGQKKQSLEEQKPKPGQKRKRKTEKQLACLQSELRGNNLLWSRQKIIQISERTGMTETQIYKWWWDQTRKRMKKLRNVANKKLLAEGSKSQAQTQATKKRRNSKLLSDEDPGVVSSRTESKEVTKRQEMADQISDLQRLQVLECSSSERIDKPQLGLKRQKTSELLASGQGFFVPAIDEFGGYSSRLRIPDALATGSSLPSSGKDSPSSEAQKKSSPRKKARESIEECKGNSSLCYMLGIDVEKLALQIVSQDVQSRGTALQSQ